MIELSYPAVVGIAVLFAVCLVLILRLGMDVLHKEPHPEVCVRPIRWDTVNEILYGYMWCQRRRAWVPFAAYAGWLGLQVRWPGLAWNAPDVKYSLDLHTGMWRYVTYAWVECRFPNDTHPDRELLKALDKSIRKNPIPDYIKAELMSRIEYA